MNYYDWFLLSCTNAFLQANTGLLCQTVNQLEDVRSLEKGAEVELMHCGTRQNLLAQVLSPADHGCKPSVSSEHAEPAGLPVQKTMKSHSIIILACSQW